MRAATDPAKSFVVMLEIVEIDAGPGGDQR
jgi:hypothetical protein